MRILLVHSHNDAEISVYSPREALHHPSWLYRDSGSDPSHSDFWAA